MSYPVPTATSDRTTVTSSSQQFSFTMVAGEFYVVTSTIGAYILQGTNPTAAAADNNTYIGPNQSVMIDGAAGAKLAIIREGSSDGAATMTLVRFVK